MNYRNENETAAFSRGLLVVALPILCFPFVYLGGRAAFWHGFGKRAICPHNRRAVSPCKMMDTTLLFWTAATVAPFTRLNTGGGFDHENRNLQEIANDLLPEAFTQAKKRRAEILAALA